MRDWALVFSGLKLSLLSCGVLVGLAASAASAAESPGKEKEPVEYEFSLATGLRSDDLRWNIAGDLFGGSPNILSELTWSDIKSVQLKAGGDVVWPWMFALKGYAAYGSIYEGDNQDSDYLGDNRTYEFSRSNSSSDGDYLVDASLAIGYPMRFGTTGFVTVTPLLGYSYHEQNLEMTDGYQTYDPIGGYTGPIPGLDSSYDTEWNGMWGGLDIRFKSPDFKQVVDRFEVFLTFEYHFFDYYAEADWNLRDELMHPVSFTHDADGSGWRMDVGVNYWLYEHFALTLSYDYTHFLAEDGLDTVYLADGTIALTKVNEVDWKTYTLNLGMAYRF